MKVFLAPGEKLTVGFYTPADQVDSGGWRAPEDLEDDGHLTIEYGPDAIVVTADLPDDEERGGHPDLVRVDGEPSNLDPVIYRASLGPPDLSDGEALVDVLDPAPAEDVAELERNLDSLGPGGPPGASHPAPPGPGAS